MSQLLWQINQIYNCQITMNYPFQTPTPIYGSPENAALYFNSLSNYYDYSFGSQQSLVPTLFPINLGCPFYSSYTSNIISEAQAQRPTDDQDPFLPQIQQQESRPQPQPIEQKELQDPIKTKKKEVIKEQIKEEAEYQLKHVKRIKNLKKNTELNLINNIYSYISCEKKSHRVLHFLLETPQKIKIFYIFTNNLKRLNGKYLNHKDLKMISQLHPNLSQAKMLAKSVKRLLVLPMSELRVVLRKSIFHYLRGDESLLPLLTSKKICKNAIQEHLHKRRQLINFMKTQLQDCNGVINNKTGKATNI